MRFRDYNDFEILDLIKSGNEEAFQLMVDKYKYLIAKKIHQFQLRDDYDDCFQESLLVLYRSILRFEDRFNKTFTKFFELNLEHHLITVIRKNTRKNKFIQEKAIFLVQESTHSADSYNGLDQAIEELLGQLSPCEKSVYQCWMINQLSIQDTANSLDLTTKQVHNAIDRIRKKLNRLLTS